MSKNFEQTKKRTFIQHGQMRKGKTDNLSLSQYRYLAFME
jgi:hypothetical protein